MSTAEVMTGAIFDDRPTLEPVTVRRDTDYFAGVMETARIARNWIEAGCLRTQADLLAFCAGFAPNMYARDVLDLARLLTDEGRITE